jgi:cytochrome b561/polyisoprenoid-binding protein YceI
MMKFLNTDDAYGLVHKTLHWLIAVLIIGLLPVGLGMTQLENSPFKLEVFAMHKSFGLVVFFLGVIRILWRFFSIRPDHLETHKGWEVNLASAAHFWLYVCIIGMPLTGWLMSSAAEFPVPFFGYQMPHLLGKDPALAQTFERAHGILGYTLLVVLALHAAGALKHHLIDKDVTLKRMTWPKAGWGIVIAIVLYMGISYGLSAGNILGIGKNSVRSGAEIAVAKPVPRAPTDTSNLSEYEWAIEKDQSRLSFRTTLYGSEFEGTFSDFGGKIIFNPDDLSSSSADITINMKQAATGDFDRDANLQYGEWFDSENYPEARFQTIQFEQMEEGRYLAIGNLTIRGVTLPVSLPFTLLIEGDTAKMEGEALLNRLDYGIGKGQWEDEKSVGHAVKVKIQLIAIR